MKKPNLNNTYHSKVDSDKSKNYQKINMTQCINLDRQMESDDSHEESNFFKKSKTNRTDKRRTSKSKNHTTYQQTTNSGEFKNFNNKSYDKAWINKYSYETLSPNISLQKNENKKKTSEDFSKTKSQYNKYEFSLKNCGDINLKEKSRELKKCSQSIQTDNCNLIQNQKHNFPSICVPTLQSFEMLNQKIAELENFKGNHLYDDLKIIIKSQSEKISNLEEKLNKYEDQSQILKNYLEKNNILTKKYEELQCKNEILIQLYICAHKLFISLDLNFLESLRSSNYIKKEEISQQKIISCFFCKQQGHSTLNCSTIIKTKKLQNDEPMHLD